MRTEKDLRLRIDLLENQSSSVAKMLAKAITDHNEVACKEYAGRLATNRGRIEELLWVLGEKAGHSVLDLQVLSKDSNISVKETIKKLKAGELKMEDLSLDVQALIRKGALEMKNKRES